MQALWTPSWKQGFARYAAESSDPGSWKGLELYYPTSLGPTGVTARDVSGKRNHGTLINDAAWVRDPERGSVFSLDGTTDYIDAGSGHTDHVTIAMWFNPDEDFDSLAVTRYMASVRETSSDIEWQLFVRTDTNDIRFRVDTAGGSSNLDTEMSGTWEAGRWYHVVATYDGVTQKIYIDGVLHVETAHTSGGNIRTGVSSRRIGDLKGGAAAEQFQGKIGDVWLYSRAIVASEVFQIYNDSDAMLRLRQAPVVVAAPAPPGGAMPMAIHHYQMAGAL